MLALSRLRRIEEDGGGVLEVVGQHEERVELDDAPPVRGIATPPTSIAASVGGIGWRGGRTARVTGSR